MKYRKKPVVVETYKTDKEIIKALEYCKDCSANLNIEIIDHITRQQAELENLKVENQSLRGAANSLKMHYEKVQAEVESLKIFKGYAEKRASDYRTMRDKYLNAKSEAVKEFAERLKNSFFDNGYESPDVDFDYFVDNLVKEME